MSSVHVRSDVYPIQWNHVNCNISKPARADVYNVTAITEIILENELRTDDP